MEWKAGGEKHNTFLSVKDTPEPQKHFTYEYHIKFKYCPLVNHLQLLKDDYIRRQMKI